MVCSQELKREAYEVWELGMKGAAYRDGEKNGKV